MKVFLSRVLNSLARTLDWLAKGARKASLRIAPKAARLPESKEAALYFPLQTASGYYWFRSNKERMLYAPAHSVEFPEGISNYVECWLDTHELPLTVAPERSNTIIAYTDGSYNPSSQAYAWAIVFQEKDRCHEIADVVLDQGKNSLRNVSAEMTAALIAVCAARRAGYAAVFVYHDFSGVDVAAQEIDAPCKPEVACYRKAIVQEMASIRVSLEKQPQQRKQTRHTHLPTSLPKRRARIFRVRQREAARPIMQDDARVLLPWRS